MIASILFILLALVLYYTGTYLLVKGSSEITLQAGISPIVAGLTVVAFGTSSPGLVLSIMANIAGRGNIVIGSVIGSNFFNIGIILGIAALVSPLKIKLQLLKGNILILILATVGFVLLFNDRQFSRGEGVMLFSGIFIYTVLTIYFARKEKNREVQDEFIGSAYPIKTKWYWSTTLLLAGIGILVAGSESLLKGAVELSRMLGAGNTIIGFTIVAAVSSLPALIYSVIATKRKQYDIALGNIIGAGVFNILGITGISAIISPLSAIAVSNIDLYVMISVTLLLLQFFRKNYTLKRDDGLLMIGFYLIYMYYLWPK
jgi:cation:H+ antiporter